MFWFRCTSFLHGSVTTVVNDEAIRLIAISYVAMALVLLISVFVYPGVSVLRRVIGAVTDISAVSLVLYYTGEAGMPLVAVYLWVIVGYGFRYGLRYLVMTTVSEPCRFFNCAVAQWAMAEQP